MSAEPSGRTGSVERVTESILPTRHGTFRIVGYRATDGTELVSLSMGVEDGLAPAEPALVRIHSECLTGDALGSRRCDCGEQLDAALARIAHDGRGALVYVRGHEGRGIGLVEKLRAYQLQDSGFDTVDANLQLGHPADARDYGQAADILRDLGLNRIRLLSSNPAKQHALEALGITVVTRVTASVPTRPENEQYLRTKQLRMSHDLPVDPASVTDLGVVGHYRELAARDRWTVAQSAQSLDGFLATRTGDGAGLSGEADHRHLHRLRSLADAVIVGAQTVVNDDPRLTVRLVAGSSPTRVLLDPQGRVPPAARVLTDDAAPTLWLTASPIQDTVADHVRTITLGPGPWAPAQIVAALAEVGLRRLLVEGGGRTVSGFVTAGELDVLYVTTVPLFLGDGVPGVRVPAVDRVSEAVRWPVRTFALGDDSCAVFRLR